MQEVQATFDKRLSRQFTNEPRKKAEGAMDSYGSDTEDTLAGRQQHRQPQILNSANGRSNHRDPADDYSSLQRRKLRIINETREREDLDGSILADQDSVSTMPPGWSNGDFLEDKDLKARWRDSIDSKDVRKGQVPSSFHDRTVDILVKLRLLPVMKSLQDPKDKGGLTQALMRAEAILQFAVKEDASQALQGRCCYYIGVAMHLLDDEEAAQYFVSALDAKGVYEEGRWAQQWTNHYDSIGELSPKRIAETQRPVSWASSIGYLRDRGLEKKRYAGSSGSPRQSPKQKKEGDVARKSPGKGIQPTTPVSQRFSLDIQDDPFKSGNFGSNTPGSKAGSSIVGGESIPSFSSWDSSSPSKTMGTLRPLQDADGMHSPKCTHVSPTQEHGKNGKSQCPANFDSTRSSPHDVLRHTRYDNSGSQVRNA